MGENWLGVEQTLRIGGAINRRELAFKAMAGLVGGAIGWFPVELATHGHSLTEVETTWNFLTVFAAMAILSGVVGGLVNAAELQTVELSRAVKLRFSAGFGVCLVLGVISNYFSDEAFTSILNAGGWRPAQPGSIVYLVIARVVGWVLMGTLLGAGVGLASFSRSNPGKTIQNVVKGAAGGFAGGLIGGLSFDLVSMLSGGGLAPRLFSFSMLGLLIGLFIGLVQELTKVAWLGVEAGRLRGRQFRLEGATVIIGRAEENPVGLFGDPGVQRRHAVIERRADGYTLKNLAVQAGTLVNGSRVEAIDLHNGDRIGMGNYELSFHLRQAAASAHLAVPVRSAPNQPAMAPPARAGPSAAAVGASAVAGPYLLAADGTRFAVGAGTTIQIGRALDNNIVLNDASVSRHHATIEARNGSFTLRDLGSQNGTWLHGGRITEATLGNGDALRLGDAVLTFHA
jgi:pSer/pThr/pTyr-binding forkhead associated (FHA) protein